MAVFNTVRVCRRVEGAPRPAGVIGWSVGISSRVKARNSRRIIQGKLMSRSLWFTLGRYCLDPDGRLWERCSLRNQFFGKNWGCDFVGVYLTNNLI